MAAVEVSSQYTSRELDHGSIQMHHSMPICKSYRLFHYLKSNRIYRPASAELPPALAEVPPAAFAGLLGFFAGLPLLLNGLLLLPLVGLLGFFEGLEELESAT